MTLMEKVISMQVTSSSSPTFTIQHYIKFVRKSIVKITLPNMLMSRIWKPFAYQLIELDFKESTGLRRKIKLCPRQLTREVKTLDSLRQDDSSNFYGRKLSNKNRVLKY